jgi:hypothetical protein
MGLARARPFFEGMFLFFDFFVAELSLEKFRNGLNSSAGSGS